MSKSVFISVPKVQGTLECEKHRTTSVSQVTKILLKVVLARIRNKIRPQISEEQYGFVKGKGTRNAIFALRNLAEKAWKSIKTFTCALLIMKRLSTRHSMRT